MNAFAVSYDLLGKAKPDYKGLIKELKRSPGWWSHLESTWLIQTEETAQELYGRLRKHLHKKDSLLIIEVRDNCQGWLLKKAWDWIHISVPSPGEAPPVKVFSVNYDLYTKMKPEYTGLIEELKQSPGWWHHLKSTWLIQTTESPNELFGRLRHHMHSMDSLLIIEVRDNCQGRLLKTKAWDWIRSRVPYPATVLN